MWSQMEPQCLWCNCDNGKENCEIGKEMIHRAKEYESSRWVGATIPSNCEKSVPKTKKLRKGTQTRSLSQLNALHFYSLLTYLNAVCSWRSFFSLRSSSIMAETSSEAVFSSISPVALIPFIFWKAFTAVSVEAL